MFYENERFGVSVPCLSHKPHFVSMSRYSTVMPNANTNMLSKPEDRIKKRRGGMDGKVLRGNGPRLGKLLIRNFDDYN
jgi:hypothetical protein